MTENFHVVVSKVEGTLLRWMKKANSKVKIGDKLALIRQMDGKTCFMESSASGTLKTLLINVKEAVTNGVDVAAIEECLHPTLYNGICASCGTFIKAPGSKHESSSSSSFSSMTVQGGHRIEVSTTEAAKTQEANKTS